ncbi:hypothetical protein D3C78_1342780 [compost metagenome]
MHSAAARHASWPGFGFSCRFGVVHTIGRPSVRPIMNRRLRMVGAPALDALRSRHCTSQPRPCTRSRMGTHWPMASMISGISGWSAGRPVVRQAMNALKVRPSSALIGRPSLSSGPHFWNSSTFSRKNMRGRVACTQRTTTQASERTRLLRGAPPLALLKWRQSGDAQRMPTGCPLVAASGSTSNTSVM